MASSFDIFEAIVQFSKKYELYELDEILSILIMLSIYFAIDATLKNRKNKILLAQTRKMSEIDYLTGMNNRRMINSHLFHLIKQMERYETNFSIILSDIDHFKNINDNYGHVIGDEVLVAVANTIKSSVRESDIIGRWGGEEFIVLCPDTKKEGALVVAEKLRKNIATIQSDHLPSVTASLGVAYCIDKNVSLDTALMRVDELLYKAKKTGRNCIVSH